MLYLEAMMGGRVVRHAVSSDRFHIGRAGENDVVIDDRSVSRRHLQVVVEDGRVELKDLGSTNGLHVGGDRVDHAVVGLDEWFSVGTVSTRIRRGGLSLSCSEERSRGKAGRRPAAITSTGRERDALGALADLAGRVEARGSRELALQEYIDHMAAMCNAAGAGLVSRSGNGWSVMAYSGEFLDEGTESGLLAAMAAGASSGESVHQAGVLAYPIRGDLDSRHWLLVHPWPAGMEPTTEMRLVAAFCLGKLPRRDDRTETRQVPAVHDPEGDAFITRSSLCRERLSEIDRFAGAGEPVLLIGESGTGKELLARRLHGRSPRRDGPFVAINCASQPAELFEAELFGIEKGVATGVDPRAGKFVLASGGTLLLDEIGDMPLALQPKLLRVLEEREVQPVGAPAPVPVDVQVVASTHRNLEKRVEESKFRQDLYHRIAGLVVRVPPLRQRPEDILPIAASLAKRAAKDQGHRCAGFDLEMTRILLGHPWPGNVRQLRNIVSRAVALADGPVLHAGLLPEGMADESDLDRGDALLGIDGTYAEAKRAFEKQYFSRLLERAGHNLSRAARLAGITRSHLYDKLEEHGLREVNR